MKRVHEILVAVMMLAILSACSKAPEKVSRNAPKEAGQQSILTMHSKVTPTVWSAPVTNDEFALVYRFGVVQSEMNIASGEMPVVIEVTNIGKTSTDLKAYDLFGCGTLIVCDFYVDGEKRGHAPVLGDALDSCITLKPGERLSRSLRGIWLVKAEGKKDLTVGFGVLVKKDGVPEESSDPKYEIKELRTAALPIRFFKGEKKKGTQQETDPAKPDK